MTTTDLYKKLKKGEISKDKWLTEVRRDPQLPWVTNLTSYDDSIKILKNKRIISEIDLNVVEVKDPNKFELGQDDDTENAPDGVNDKAASKPLKDKVTIKSFLEKISQQIWGEKSIDIAKQMMKDFVANSKINDEDKKKILRNIEPITSKMKLDQYLANSLLGYEGHGLSQLKRKSNEGENPENIQGRADAINAFAKMAKSKSTKVDQLAVEFEAIRDFPKDYDITSDEASKILKKYDRYEEVLNHLSNEDSTDPAGGRGIDSHVEEAGDFIGGGRGADSKGWNQQARVNAINKLAKKIQNPDTKDETLARDWMGAHYFPGESLIKDTEMEKILKKYNRWESVEKIVNSLLSREGDRKDDKEDLDVDDMLGEEKNSQNKFNQPDYNWYIVDKNSNQIQTGWEFASDAKDAFTDQEMTLDKFRISSKRTLRSQGIDPNESKNWGSGKVNEEENKDKDKLSKKIENFINKFIKIGFERNQAIEYLKQYGTDVVKQTLSKGNITENIDINPYIELASQYTDEDLNDVSNREYKNSYEIINIIKDYIPGESQKEFLTKAKQIVNPMDYMKFHPMPWSGGGDNKLKDLKEGKEDTKDYTALLYKKNSIQPKEKDADHVIWDEYQRGIRYELEKQGDLDLEKAMKKSLANLNKDGLFYTRILSGQSKKDMEKLQKPVGTMEPVSNKGDNKASNQMEKAGKVSKDKVNDSLNKKEKQKGKNGKKIKIMSITPKKSKGVKVMDMPGKEKKIKLKEGDESVKGNSFKFFIQEVVDKFTSHFGFDLEEASFIVRNNTKALKEMFEQGTKPDKAFDSLVSTSVKVNEKSDESVDNLDEWIGDIMTYYKDILHFSEEEAKAIIKNNINELAKLYNMNSSVENAFDSLMRKDAKLNEKDIDEDLYKDTKSGAVQSFNPIDPTDKKTLNDPKFKSKYKKEM